MSGFFVNQVFHGDWIDVARRLFDKCIHTIITSPPYWGQRNYGVEGQLGLEKTPEEHIDKLVAGFNELRRILRDDGTLWVNYGDKYAGGGNNRGNNSPLSAKQASNKGATGQVADCYLVENLPNGNLIGLAWRLALAMQADGWILRDDIIWAKAVSCCETYSGSTMPESVNGWRWERCRVKVKNHGREQSRINGHFQDHSGNEVNSDAQWSDCPGCPKCEPNGGYVLRQGSWRPTRAHEYVFQFAKTGSYFCDAEAVKEPHAEPERGQRRAESQNPHNAPKESMSIRWVPGEREYNPSGRNLRDVWTINPQPWGRAHYATFPEKLIEPIIKVATSQKGVCPKCGAPWARIIRSKQVKRERPADSTDRHKQGRGVNSCGNTAAGVECTTLGWRATCGCGTDETVPAVCYDPFMGSGTVAAVAAKLGRNYCGSELNETYLNKQARLRIQSAEHGLDVAEIEKGQKTFFE